MDFDGCITYGPWGGSKGKEWVYMPQGLTKKIQIMVRHDSSAFTSIELKSYCSKGEGQKSIFGSNFDGGWTTDIICFDNTNEYLMSISGTYGCYDDYSKDVVLKSICFTTNLHLYGPYGRTHGDHAFSHDIKDEVVVGFHGRAGGKYLNAIGVYVKPKSPSLVRNSMIEVSSSISREVMPRDIGPWGAGGGRSWDDGVFSAIKQVCVHLGELNVIYALQFMYQKANGISVLSPIHGGTDGPNIQLVNLDGSDEFFTGLSGFYGPVEGYNGLEAITSISFHTNKRIYGPYGEERGAGYVYFCSTQSPGKVVGFHGRTNGFLGAIGVLMEYF